MKKRYSVDNKLLQAYRRMSEDKAHEAEAEEWIEALIEDAVELPD